MNVLLPSSFIEPYLVGILTEPTKLPKNNHTDTHHFLPDHRQADRVSFVLLYDSKSVV